jgi:hypothetical protein
VKSLITCSPSSSRDGSDPVGTAPLDEAQLLFLGEVASFLARSDHSFDRQRGKSLLQLIGAYKALAAAPIGASAWQPIETAPRDGSKFWGKIDDDAVTMFWMEEFNGFVSSYRQMVMAAGYTVDGGPFKNHSPQYHTPSHWMPLPSPPLSAKDTSGESDRTRDEQSKPTGASVS